MQRRNSASKHRSDLWSEQSYNRTVQSVSSVDALAVPWSAVEARLALPSALGVAGIPALVLTSPTGSVLTVNGRTHLAADPLGLSAVEARLALPSALGVAGIPALVLTSPTGSVLTVNGRTHLAADPLGLVSKTSYNRTVQSVSLVDALAVSWNAVKALPSTLGVAGIPALVLTSPTGSVLTVNGRTHLAADPLGLVSKTSYNRTVQSVSLVDALAVPWSAVKTRLALPSALGVAGIPALVLTSPTGSVLTVNGRTHLADDPLGLNFPWAARPVSVLTEQALLKMARHAALVLFVDDEDSEIEFAESVLTPSAESYYEECSIQYPGFCPYQNSSDDETMDFDYPTSKHSRVKKKSFKHVMFYIGIDGTDSADMLREHIGLDDAVPLLTAIDFPKQRMVTMNYGDEITTDSVQNFVDAYLSGNADFKPLKPYSEKC
ncbi:nucleoredoxin-like [Ostrinia furnacalis]|uniref:nucleoredoxin-like n=2 Tax=Ostrinia TaxID=29056 RepID=UPI00103D6AA9|nr:nucleoredoxin-like [Ostrinia furnacalis]